MNLSHRTTILLVVVCLIAPAALANDDPILVDGIAFDSWQEYVNSDYFRNEGKRCGTLSPGRISAETFGDPSDCALWTNVPSPEYAPTDTIVLQVVVHIIWRSNGDGVIPDSLVHSQMEILNEDFLAMAGTNGGPGTNTAIQFVLASVDPDGNPTTGITRKKSFNFFWEIGDYWETLSWDPTRYINIYTNSASGYLGYVPFFPQQGGHGSIEDRVVVLWSAFGRNAPIGHPYDQGRTLTHEMGHFLGLWHVFDNGCGVGTPPDCYATGDLICDTNGENLAFSGCPSNPMSCGTPAPIHNYMDYTNDICMWEFTPEQTLRMRCTLEHYRTSLVDVPTGIAIADRAESPAPTHARALRANVPNPFNPATTIRYRLEESDVVSLSIHDVSGRLVATLVDSESRERGDHEVTWDGTDRRGAPASSGVYFYTLEGGTGREVRRMTLLR